MDAQPIPTEQRPIGFWLKLVDRLIDDTFDRVLSGQRLTRRHWQVLNVLHQASASIDEIDEKVRPFLDEREPTAQRVVDDLVRAGSVANDHGRFTLTPAGHDLFRIVQEDVARFRQRLVVGIAPEEYASTLSALERMARNLGWSDQR